MALGDSAGLLFKIKSEYDKTGVTEAKTDVTELSGAAEGLSGALGPLAIAGTVAAAAIAAVGAAAVTTAVGLFNMAERASEVGSRLFDMQQKTGLSAATLSTLDIAAKQSGSSLEQVSTATEKFAKLMGQAAGGNEKAQATLKALGVTSTDLNTALSQVYGTINNAKEGVDQITLAQIAFGKSGADIIPVIKQLNGDLTTATKNAQDLGLTLTDNDIKAADDFGDTLAQLKGQVSNAATVFALQFAPVITEAMLRVSDALADNRDAFREWGDNFGHALHSVITFIDQIHAFNQAVYSMVPAMADAGHGIDTTLVVPLNRAQNAIARVIGLLQQLNLIAVGTEGSGQIRTTLGSASGGASVLPLLNLGGGRGGGGGGRSGGGRAPRDTSAADAKRAEQQRIAQIRADAQDEIQIQAAKNAVILERYKADLEDGNISAHDAMLYRQKLEDDFLAFKIDVLARELAAVTQSTLEESERVKEETNLKTQLLVLNSGKEEQAFKHRLEQSQQTKKENKDREEELQRQIKLQQEWNDVVTESMKASKEAADAYFASLENITQAEKDAAAAAEAKRQQHQSDLQNNPIGLLMDKFQDNGAATAVIGSLSDAFSQLGQAVGSAVEALVLYGNAGGNLKQVTAKILAAVAAQAAAKAVFELAEGLACLALAFFGDPAAGAAAGFHFAAAAAYGVIAGVTGLAGRAVAGNSFKQASAGGGTGSSAGGGNGSNGQDNRSNTPFSRSSPNAFDSGSRIVEAISRNTEVMKDLHGTQLGLAAKIASMRPGDVVVRGLNERPGAAGNAVVKDLGRSPQIGNQINRRLGNR